MTDQSYPTKSAAKGTFHRLDPERRKRVVRSAVDEFARRSYEGASMSRIATTASIAKGSIYQYFENKLSMYQWIVEEHAPSVREYYLERHKRNQPNVFEQLEALVLADLHFFANEPQLAHLAFSAEESHPSSELKSIHDRVVIKQRAALVKSLEKAQSRNELRADLEQKHALSLLKWLRGPSLERIILEEFEFDLDGALNSDDLTLTMRRLKLRSLAFDLVDVLKNGLKRRLDS